MQKITTVSKAVNREIETTAPDLLTVSNLDEMIATLVQHGDMDEDAARALIFKKAGDQLIVDYRSNVRGLMEAVVKDKVDDEGKPVLAHTDEFIITEMSKPNWVPKVRQRLSDVDKLSRALSGVADTEKLIDAMVQQRGCTREEAADFLALFGVSK